MGQTSGVLSCEKMVEMEEETTNKSNHTKNKQFFGQEMYQKKNQ